MEVSPHRERVFVFFFAPSCCSFLTLANGLTRPVSPVHDDRSTMIRTLLPVAHINLRHFTTTGSGSNKGVSHIYAFSCKIRLTVESSLTCKCNPQHRRSHVINAYVHEESPMYAHHKYGGNLRRINGLTTLLDTCRQWFESYWLAHQYSARASWFH
ncbi:hypothetical protein B0F90DRAFT_1714474 [Multifurca ochricompacta]|uniref:Uncharacterized protein n=1 Tax=Multifurca ochricompacta TaxID=376703 RepID=A0AAD4M5U0_9AGAM|nr:hypothetical protein B0F90DRAFT_1714474 [Multifurca ochricompacta]